MRCCDFSALELEGNCLDHRLTDDQLAKIPDGVTGTFMQKLAVRKVA
ncbi:hypothetical protein [Enterococcus faecalis]|nr:hypothetical protein [Enterococcus faecalis]